MNHVTLEAIEHADDDVMEHLEACGRCRSRVTVDVDLNGVRQRLVDELAIEELVGGAGGRWMLWRGRPWAVAATAAAVTVALFVPVLWLGLLRSGDRLEPGSGETGGTVPVVELPEWSPAPRPEPPVPTGDREVPSFEMSFSVGDGIVGRLIWDSSTFYEGIRANLTADGPVYEYGFYMAGTDRGMDFPGGEFADLPDDPLILWDLLINRLPEQVLWARVATDGVDPIEVEATHPEAAQAWASPAGETRLEVTDDGIPVLIERPGQEPFRVVSLTRRSIRAGELGNNTDLPFDYAIFLAATTSDEQLEVLADGIVTFSDYKTAAVAAAQCAGIGPVFDDSVGMFTFSDDQTTVQCVERYVDDIAAVWRVDSQWLDEDEFTILDYTIEGRNDLVEMHQTEPEPERALASGDGWAISISRRGPGYCTRTSAMNSFGFGCFLASDMIIPDALTVYIGILYDQDQVLLEGYVMGLVTDRSDRVVVRYTSGAKTEITPGHLVEFGFRGFGILIDGSAGEPAGVEVYSGTELIATYDIENEHG